MHFLARWHRRRRGFVSLVFMKGTSDLYLLFRIFLVTWLQFDFDYYYKPSIWLRRPGLCSSQMISWVDVSKMTYDVLIGTLNRTITN